jgi:hypothetical protein
MSGIANGDERYPCRDTRTPQEGSPSADGRPDSVRRPDYCRCAPAAGEWRTMRVHGGHRARGRMKSPETCRYSLIGRERERSLSRRRPSRCRRSGDYGRSTTGKRGFSRIPASVEGNLIPPEERRLGGVRFRNRP